ncbi:hypothetical protein D3C86_1973570 [compost metagenome]
MHMLRHLRKQGGIHAMPCEERQQQRRHRQLLAPQELHLPQAGLREENRRARALLEPPCHPVMIGMVMGEHNLLDVLKGNPAFLKHRVPKLFRFLCM